MNRSSRLLWAWGVIGVLLSACGGPKASVQPEYAAKSSQVVAVLYSVPPAGLPRERVEFMREILRTELSNSGFVVLDDKLVRETCSEANCPERGLLASKYNVGGFFALELNSSSNINFFAGYYNYIEGVLKYSDVEDSELARVEHTERQRGGVLFQSGQVLQGIIEQVRNGSEEAKNELGVKFVRSLVAKIPPAMRAGELQQRFAVRIEKVTTKEIKPEVKEVCVTGSRDGIAALVVQGVKSALRETAPGSYCGIFRVNPAWRSPGRESVIELRSPFGNAVRQKMSWV